MEIFIQGVRPQVDETEARLKLIQEIASVAHHYPLSSPHEPPINFDLQVQHQRQQTPGRGRYRQSEPATAFWYLTFPSISFGERFLAHLENVNTRAAAFGPNLRFSVSTTKVGNTSKRTPKVPHPGLVHLLKDSVFRNPAEERAQIAEAKLSAGSILLRDLSFGRIQQSEGQASTQPFLAEFGWIFESDTQANLVFNPELGSLVITIIQSGDNRVQTLSIRFKNVLRIEAESPSITLFLSSPPVLHVKRSDENQMMEIFGIQMSSFLRQEKKLRVSSFNADHALAMPYVGKLLRLTFKSHQQFNLFVFQQKHHRTPKIITLPRDVIRSNNFSSLKRSLWMMALSRLDVRIAFLLEYLVFNHHLDFASVHELRRRVEGIDVERAERALMVMIRDLGTPIDEAHHVPTAEDAHTSSSLSEKLEAALSARSYHRHALEEAIEQNGLFWSRSLTITPTSMILDLPVLEESNSVLRRYANPQFFIRVALRDEDGSSHYAERDTDLPAFLRGRYLEFLTKGLRFAGRTFEFLGYSSSALKDHQAWFVCPFEFQGQTITAAVIRDQMGDFSRVNRIPARYMARIAQAFTTTREALKLKPHQIESIPDVEKNGSVFTDGVGTISPALARKVEEALSSGSRSSGRHKNLNKSTCYQIRFGGYKGMISIDNTLVGEIVRLRPSMNKFDAPDSLSLNIASSFRRPLHAFLNRPLIKILEDLSIHPEVFLKCQRMAVTVIEEARKSFKRASKLLNRHGLGESVGLSGLLNRIGGLEGVEVGASGFIEECLDLAVVHCLKDLKYRARIPLPGSHTLVGVADEDQILEPGQVYACIREPGRSKTYVSGRIAITRSPCCHPGDVQLVTAIGRPPANARRLSSLTNCVVFSVKGERSLPSCLGGGDLDGDIYTLITDPELVPLPRHIHTPASYDPPKMNMLDRQCTIEDGAKFLLDYIASDLVGQIATRYLQISDASVDGTRDPDCLKLSQLHSDAVDYPKTGVPVNSMSLPRSGKARPDFMSPEYLTSNQRSNNEKFYMSTKALGQLFRDIPVEVIEEDTLRLLRRQQRGDQRGRAGLDEDFVLTKAVENLLASKLGAYWDFPDEEEERIWTEDMTVLAEAFGGEYWKICRLNTLGAGMGRGTAALSETEAFVGVIAASSGDRREKREATIRLGTQTDELFGMLRAEIVGETEYGVEEMMGALELEDGQQPGPIRVEVVRRAWAAWRVAREKSVAVVEEPKLKGAQPAWFGIRSFGMVALDLVLGEVMA